MAVVRKCEQCGRIDARVSWPSAKDAGKDPVLATWTCPMCAWTEFDLVEAEEEPAAGRAELPTPGRRAAGRLCAGIGRRRPALTPPVLS